MQEVNSFVFWYEILSGIENDNMGSSNKSD
jgi:hypothetical protein